MLACAQEPEPSPAWDLINDARLAIEAGALLDAENLLQSAIQTASTGQDEAARMAGALELAELYISQVKLAEATAIASLAVEAARKLGDTRAAAQLLLRLGSVWRVVGQYDQAASALIEAHALFSEAGDISGQASALLSLGILADLSGELAVAADYFGNARELYRQLGDEACIAQCYSNQAYALSRMGDNDRAIADYQQSIYIYQQLNQPTKEAEVHIALGHVYQLLNDGTGALAEFEVSLELLDPQVHPFLAAQATQGAGLALVAQGELSLAAEHFEQAWPMYERVLAVEDLKLLLKQMAPVFDELGRGGMLSDYRARLNALLQ